MGIDKGKVGYHHGALRKNLLDAAERIISDHGIESLSLRRLSQEVGVSRSALYHHFKGKSQLLCAIAERGFLRFYDFIDTSFQDDGRSLEERIRVFAFGYIGFAVDNCEIYELMFGRYIWREERSSDSLRDIAYACFQRQLDISSVFLSSNADDNENVLRLAQVTWGSLHGIAKLVVDGVYANGDQIEEICECAVNLLLLQLKPES